MERDRFAPHEGTNLSDIAAASDAADLEAEYEEHEIFADEPAD